MSAAIAIPVAAQASMLQGYGQFFLDAGSTGNAVLMFFSGARPDGGETPPGTMLVSVQLARPSNFLTSEGRLRLVMGNPSGTMAVATGVATWARLVTAQGYWAGDGDVTDEAGDGAFKIAGEGTLIRAGGYVVLSATSELGV